MAYPWHETLGCLVTAYLIGGIPTSIWTCKVLKGIDIRTVGSGNAGATNVYRVLGLKVALFVGLIDCLKGVAAVLLARKVLGPQAEVGLIAAGLVAMLGHVYTIFAGFRGGKGVLVALGVFLTLDPAAALSSFGVWFLVTWVSRYVSLGSMSAAVLLPIFTTAFDRAGVFPVGKPVLIFTVIAAFLVIFTHRSNIKRLLGGTEKKVGRKKESA